MVEEQIVQRGINVGRVSEAMREIPRHIFVPREEKKWAYIDGPIPLGYGQTISQPYMVALMTQALALGGNEKVLEIGTGSGYQAAILSKLAKQVYSVERIEELARRAKRTLAKLGILNVRVVYGNGCLGLPEEAPFDAIIVTAAAPEVPKPLTEQLAEGGRLVLPVGERGTQTLVKITKAGNTVHKEDLGLCAFVPLIGRSGWESS
ncbi:MAG: protein-L-isoaspartate(D-aspartate) O-methyltransferase [Candidatus Binatia bacterium]